MELSKDSSSSSSAAAKTGPPSAGVMQAHRKHMFLSGGVSADSCLSVGCHYKEMSQHCGMNQ